MKNGNFNFSILGFRYFEFLFIYERILNRIRIRIFGIFVLALLGSDTNCSSQFLWQTVHLLKTDRRWVTFATTNKSNNKVNLKTI